MPYKAGQILKSIGTDLGDFFIEVNPGVRKNYNLRSIMNNYQYKPLSYKELMSKGLELIK